jgi:hypothetical protein
LKGDRRRYDFVISISSDGFNFIDVYIGTSSGVTVCLEKYYFGYCNARYIKIAVFGNTQNNWSSITEIEVYGSNKILAARTF